MNEAPPINAVRFEGWLVENLGNPGQWYLATDKQLEDIRQPTNLRGRPVFAVMPSGWKPGD